MATTKPRSPRPTRRRRPPRKPRTLTVLDQTYRMVPVIHQRGWILTDPSGTWIGRFPNLAIAAEAAEVHARDLISCGAGSIAHT